ncbi:hypothetical protein Goshw_016771 [Gossypium schwendimanii]|uniref:Uncharacterized protein n=1 Tax=Gossypium schwendimanii TaxID=34291 RepID=A0A7J9MTW7_GOSSC|nr:hypothetical protein [Gossypium schwendimanii]
MNNGNRVAHVKTGNESQSDSKSQVFDDPDIVALNLEKWHAFRSSNDLISLKIHNINFSTLPFPIFIRKVSKILNKFSVKPGSTEAEMMNTIKERTNIVQPH